MRSNGHFVAQVLETSASGYAGLTANLLLERNPDIAERYKPDGFRSWKAQFQQWLLDLSASLVVDEPAMFESRMRWTSKAFAAREAPLEDLQAALAALRDTLRERLPESSADAAVAFVDRALAAVAAPQDGETGGLDPGRPAGRAALSYLKTILEGNPRRAIDRLLAEVDGGTAIRDAYLKVLIPAQREVGRMWHAGELSVAEEHLITATTQRAMALLCERGRASQSTDRTVLLACVAGNVHDIGLRAISDFFEMAGWRAINLGPDAPHEEIARTLHFFDANLVVLAATLDPQLRSMQDAIERIRSLKDRDVKILVGGPVFDTVPDLWRKLGADGYAATVEEAVPLADRLLGTAS